MRTTQDIYFQRLLNLLDEQGYLPAAARQCRLSEPDEVLSKLTELGVSAEPLTQALATIFNLEVYTPEAHGEITILSEDGKWAVAGNTFFTINPFVYSIQPEAVLSTTQSQDIRHLGLLANGVCNSAILLSENYAAAEIQIREWLHQACEMGASDVHIAPLSTNYVRVRVRLDGYLCSLAEIQMHDDTSGKSYRYISNMLMRLAGMEAGAFTKPTDGRFEIKLQNDIYEVRMNMRPVVVCGKASQAFYLRLFGGRHKQDFKRITSLNLPQTVHNTFAELRRLSQNLILVTGPTGSGKSTTLYANLREILYETPGRSIQTLEDPVECHIDGIEQTEINNQAGMSFETGLRAMMRSDVDVILVGEVRDAETAKLVLRASLTGHLVFATIHTKSALAAIERFADFGVSRKMLAAVLAGIFAQRLVRKTCTSCQGKTGGCEKCNNGYAGRCLVVELIKIDKELSNAIAEGNSFQQLETISKKSGNLMLWDCAKELIRKGTTTLEECKAQLPP